MQEYCTLWSHLPTQSAAPRRSGGNYQKEPTKIDTEQTIELDRKHRCIRSGSNWVVQRLQPDGAWDMIDHWTGSRRSLIHWLEKNDVHPTREAEAALDLLSEGTGFRERT